MAKPSGTGIRRSLSGSRAAASMTESQQMSLDQFGAVRLGSSHPGFSEMPLTRFDGTAFKVSCCQHMGDRKTQEDRFLIVPKLDAAEDGSSDSAVFSVFDGTVGDFASDNIKDILVPTLLEGEAWKRCAQASPADRGPLLQQGLRQAYMTSDSKLLERCSRQKQHYATSTGVTVLVAHGYLLCCHLGDSRIVLGIDRDGELVGEQATDDHKPDQDTERKRIEECGGMVERLLNHNNKPFIRGGDFMMRKALGEQPMQLQYSRAFGGKDLKIFGLSSTPDVMVVPRTKEIRWAILASDGLWDVVTTQQAVNIADQALKEEQNPSAALIRFALLEQSKRKARADNITAVCVQFD